MPDSPDYVGSATMDQDQNIILDLRARDEGGRLGIGRVVYAPTHAHYRMVLEHLGGLEPGEKKAVRPFPPNWGSA